MLRFLNKLMGSAAVALIAAPLALAGGSLAGGVYGGTGGNVQSATAGQQASVGTLPFTGLGLGLFVVFGVALLATGMLLLRKSATR